MFPLYDVELENIPVMQKGVEWKPTLEEGGGGGGGWGILHYACGRSKDMLWSKGLKIAHSCSA